MGSVVVAEAKDGTMILRVPLDFALERFLRVIAVAVGSIAKEAVQTPKVTS